jgi:hypothetical protein
MARPSTITKRTCFTEADFHVGDNGSVKLVDPLGYRLQQDLYDGHPVVSFAGHVYYVADLVARAHLGSKEGFISFRDGDRTNVRPDNLIIDTTDADWDRSVALMTRKREQVPLRNDRDRLWWREDNRTGKAPVRMAPAEKIAA